MQWEVTVASVVVVVFDGSDDDGLVFVIIKFSVCLVVIFVSSCLLLVSRITCDSDSTI